MTVLSPGTTSQRARPSALRRWSPAVPYLAVGLGLFVLHNAWVAMGLYHLGMLAVLLGERRHDTLRALLRGYHPGLLLAAIMLCLVGGAFTYFAWPLVGLPEFSDRLTRVGLPAAALPAFFLYFSLVNPILEESFWRGYHGHPATRPIWHDLWFGGYHVFVLAHFMHWHWLPLVLAGLVGIAWVWRQLAHRLDGLFINATSHIAADLSVVAAVLLVLR